MSFLETVCKHISVFSPNAITVISKTFSTLYLHLLVGVYLSILLTGLSSLPQHHHDIEPGGMLLFLYLGSNLYLVLLLCLYTREGRSAYSRSSHGSAFVRQGAFVFGVGSLLYTFLGFVSSVLSSGSEDSSCHVLIHRLNSFFLSTFVLLQMVLVILFPRLNLRHERGVSHFGLMHLIATNAILWIRTIVKESILEFHEIGVEELSKHELPESEEKELSFGEKGDELRMQSAAAAAHHSQELNECYVSVRDNFPRLFSLLEVGTPMLYPFMIEFSLIGCTVFFSMWRAVGNQGVSDRSYRVDVKNYLRNLDWRGSRRGLILGLVCLILNLINLIVFLQLDSSYDNTDQWIAKLFNTMTNTVNVVATSIAIVKIQALDDKENVESLDSLLLYLSGFFVCLYSILEILVGVYGEQETGGFAGLQILNGVFSVVSTLLQIIFIQINLTKEARQKPTGGAATSDYHGDGSTQQGEKAQSQASYPGRQEIMFLSLLNLTQWLVSTFALQKSKASRAEAAYFGAYSWVLIQRITLPLSIFYRFHSTVVLVDSWKANYKTT